MLGGAECLSANILCAGNTQCCTQCPKCSDW